MYLRVLKGRWCHTVVALPNGKPFIIGRIESCDLTFAEDMVSRAHASLTANGKTVSIQDLSSTNGTFVNGRRVAGEFEAWDGDLVLVGRSIVRIEPGTVAAPKLEDEWANGPPGRASLAWSASLDEIPLPTVLRLMQTTKATGVLRLTGDAGEESVTLRKGHIVGVVVARKKRTDLVFAAKHLLGRGGLVELGKADDEAPADGVSIEDVLAV